MQRETCPLLESLQNDMVSVGTPRHRGVKTTVRQNLSQAEHDEGTYPAACTEEPAHATSNALRFCAKF